MTANLLRLTALALGFGALAAPSAATAAKKPCRPSSTNPAVQQYTELLPTACGERVASAGQKVAKLPPSVARRLPAGRNGALLERIATSSAYGAPASRPFSGSDAAKTGTRGKTQTGAGPATATRSQRLEVTQARQKQRAPVAEAVGTLSSGGGSDNRLLALAIVMGAATVLAFGAAAARLAASRRRR